MSRHLQSIGAEIWVYEGTMPRFSGSPLSARMTVVRLASGHLWLHSPVKIDQYLQCALSLLGEVRYLVAPNTAHHLLLPEWRRACPQASIYAAPAPAGIKNGIEVAGELSSLPQEKWAGDLAQLLFVGDRKMTEAVFFHQPSSTLILNDLPEHGRKDSPRWWRRSMARLAGMLAPQDKSPLDWRTSLASASGKETRTSLACMLEWGPENIVASYGGCVFGGGAAFLRSSFCSLSESV